MLQPVVEDPYSSRSIASCASAISLRNSSGSDVCRIPPARGQFEFLAQNLELLDDISNRPLDPVIRVGAIRRLFAKKHWSMRFNGDFATVIVLCIGMPLRDDSVIIASPATREVSMKSSWQTDTGTLACHWSEAGQQVRYNSAWMQEASNIQGSYLQPLPDFASHSPFGGELHWTGRKSE